MNKNDKIYVAGHNGMVGSAIVRALNKECFFNIITAPKTEIDLRNEKMVKDFFKRERPDIVFLAAAKVGGIQANRQYPFEFLFDNLMIQNNIIKCCIDYYIERLVFLGSSCIYPTNCPQPIKEEYLMTGPLEPTNEGYALAKISGLKLAQYSNFEFGLECLIPIPCNLYGVNDTFDPNKSHVMAALVKKFIDAADDNQKTVSVWGTGLARREFMHVDDLADALIFLIKRWKSSDIINVGVGDDISIRDLAELIAHKTHFTGSITWDTSMPDGMMKKCLDISKLKSLGFSPKISLEDGIDLLINDYRKLKKIQLGNVQGESI